MFGLEADIAVFTLVVATVTTVVCKTNEKRRLKRLREELIQAKASLLSMETEVSELKMALDEKASGDLS
jgi:hypothetical protein